MYTKIEQIIFLYHFNDDLAFLCNWYRLLCLILFKAP